MIKTSNVFLASLFVISPILASSCQDENTCENPPIPEFIEYYPQYQIDKSANAPSLALDNNDHVHIAYVVLTESGQTELRYAKDKEGRWQIFIIDIINDRIHSNSISTAIAIDEQDKTHIIFAFGGTIKYYSDSQGFWTQEKIESKSEDASDDAQYSYPSITVSVNGTVHVIYVIHSEKSINETAIVSYQTALRHAQRSIHNIEQKWNLEDIHIVITDEYNQEPLIAPSSAVLDADSNIHLAYCDRQTNTLVYLTNSNFNNANPSGSWQSRPLDGYNCEGTSPDLIISSNNTLHIAFQNFNGYELTLKYGYYKNNRWRFFVVKTYPAEENSFHNRQNRETYPINLALHGDKVYLAHLRAIKDCRLADIFISDAYRYPIYYDLESQPQIIPAPYFYFYGKNSVSLEFFALDSDSHPILAGGYEKLYLSKGKLEKIEGNQAYSKPFTRPCDDISITTCEFPPPVQCHDSNDQCQYVFPNMNQAGIQEKLSPAIAVLPEDIASEEITTTSCNDSDCTCYPCCFSDADCEDNHYCTTNICLPNQRCAFTKIDGCCETDKNCEIDGNPNTIDQCINHECQLICTRACEGKQCGVDECGEICGVCANPREECQNGQCVCIPDCRNKECGPDGCGNICAECANPQEECQNGQCVCIPNCRNNECGEDGCGHTCGECAERQNCVENQCQGTLANVCIFANNCDECAPGTICWNLENRGLDLVLQQGENYLRTDFLCGNVCRNDADCGGGWECISEGQQGCFPELEHRCMGIAGAYYYCGAYRGDILFVCDNRPDRPVRRCIVSEATETGFDCELVE